MTLQETALRAVSTLGVLAALFAACSSSSSKVSGVPDAGVDGGAGDGGSACDTYFDAQLAYSTRCSERYDPARTQDLRQRFDSQCEASPLGLFALLGAAAMLAATTQGPISAAVLMIELTGRDRSIIVPMLLAIAIATLVSRTIEPRSIYDARLSDEQVAERQKMRERVVI